MSRGYQFGSTVVCDTRKRCHIGDPLNVARGLGLKRYFSGKPCQRGHVGLRKTNDGFKCLECIKLRKNGYRKGAAWARERIRRRVRRSKRSDASGHFNFDDLHRIYLLQKGRCAYCRAFLGLDFHVDHIVPVALGGTNDPVNLQLACPNCNVAKGATPPAAFAQSLGLLI